jgi:general secretion pathway protein G
MITKRDVILLYFILFLFLFVFFMIIGPHIFSDRNVITESRIDTISDGLNRYKNDVGHYPTNDQGLRVLYEKPSGVDGDKWNGPYRINRILRDQWGMDFNYCYPGIHNIKSFDLWSYGRDGKPGGKKDDADIGNW